MTKDHTKKVKTLDIVREKKSMKDSAAELFVGGWESFDYNKHFNGKK